MDAPSPALQARLLPLLAPARPVAWRRVSRGYTPAERWVVRLDNGTSRFLKIGVVGRTATWLREEHHLYMQVEADFLPRFHGWDDDARVPILMLEDLSGAYWPPPWRPGDVERVLRVLDTVHAADVYGARPCGRPEGWRSVALNPAPFLALGLCSDAWLTAALPSLRRAEENVPWYGEEFVHGDLRSDNVCFAGDRAVLVDWSAAGRANGLVDLAAWLPSLAAEGGPAPEALLPDAPTWAASMSGYFAANAGLPAIDDAPGVREVQLAQLKTALPWAVRALGLPPLNWAAHGL